MNKVNKPTEAELEILQILWAKGPSSVRDVNDLLNKKNQTGKAIGYTTTLKIMQIMLEKGLAKRDTTSRTHVYEAAVSEAATQQQLLDRFLQTAFKGSAGKLVMQALGNHKASSRELDEIKALIKKIENQEDENNK